jgi:hypothetical protein
MFIRQCHRVNNGRRHAYCALVESYRSAGGPRQRVVAWLGKLDEAGRLGIKQTAEGLADADEAASVPIADRPQPLSRQMRFEFDDDASAVTPRWVEVNAAGVRVENLRQFGGP